MRARYLEPDELARLFACMKEREALPVRLALLTGLRVGDCVALRPCQIVIEAGREKKTFIWYKSQKTGKIGRAYIPTAFAREILAQSGVVWCFPSKRDPTKHLRRESVWARVKRAGDRAGLVLGGLSPHSFRKCFGVETFQKHGIVAAKKALQHSDITTTEIYALSDFLSGENAKKPLTRGDLPMILRVLEDGLKNL